MKNEIKSNSKLLFNEEPITINRLGARVLGLNEAIVVQQIHYWLEINRKAEKNFYEDRYWTYNTYEEWTRKNFDFWSKRTVQRIFKKLFDDKILIKGNFNKKGYDQTIWVSIDYNKLDEILNEYEKSIEISTECQSVTMSDTNIMTDCHGGVTDCHGGVTDCHSHDDRLSLPIPETTTEISTKTNTEISFTTQSENKSLVVEKNEIVKIIEENTHLLLDSKNKQNKVYGWNKDRLLKSIEIFKEKEGEYFSLLEKIYKDDKNFVHKSNESSATDNKGNDTGVFVPSFKIKRNQHNCINETFRNYQPDELERLLKESQKDKF